MRIMLIIGVNEDDSIDVISDPFTDTQKALDAYYKIRGNNGLVKNKGQKPNVQYKQVFILDSRRPYKRFHTRD